MHQASGASHSNAGSGPRATIRDVEFVHCLDRASPNLAKYCAVGQTIPKAALFSRMAGGTPQEFMRWSMDDVRVTVVEPVGAGGTIVERVALSFVRMKYEYVLLTNLGQRGGTVTALFDLRSQESIVTRMRTTSNRSFAFTCADLPPSVARS
ncbi:type VI secretion system tube protein Hcp [Caballeronia sp. LZ033]|uniref:Hcp family type VI secretion system effector n=1 Tax=Caballeronia sp. LZ033 TaxID=3038566 RepID=UPI00286179A0|nr:type VI secretion system tube protein Hcp [Caballeronia sp. LZ033]MDR5818077.1 type VI secretion system tube protein Hcp [Caballeronia sp. LZ033]